MNLPIEFLSKMENLLKDEYREFLHSYQDNKKQGLRVNTLKVRIEQFIEIAPFSLEPIPWVQSGFYYQESDRPGKHPYHEAGLYYIQEPSAMAVAELVDPQPGEKILDLCAAPGGKTTQMAAKMNQSGFLLANEIHPARAKILSQNIERLGITNAVVTNETPAHLAKRFPGYFDRILVDAPCSGEGMFRKDPEACEQWSLENVAACASRQLDILKHASEMLRVGGRLVYSTCTFSPEENEGVISQFLQEDSRFEIEEVTAFEGFGTGRTDFITNPAPAIDKTFRLWPHQLQGEGHYVAVLKKKDGQEVRKWNSGEFIANKKQIVDFLKFAKDTLRSTPEGEFVLFGDQLYMIPHEMLSFKQLKIVRPGWHLGTLKKNRFEPAHALALALKEKDVYSHWQLDVDSRATIAYLRGEALHGDGQKGWMLVNVNGFSIGWGKYTNGILKNHYPKGLRWK